VLRKGGQAVQEEEGKVVGRLSLVTEVIGRRESSKRVIVSAATPCCINRLEMFLGSFIL